MSTKEEAFVDWAKVNAFHDGSFSQGRTFSDDCPEILVMSVNGNSPYQAEGFLNGLPFVFQSRHGKTELFVGKLNSINAVRDVLYKFEIDSAIENNKDFAKALPLMVMRLEKVS